MTTSTDVKWIDDFYIRIMHQKDPLTLYHKAVRKRSVEKATVARKTLSKIPTKVSSKAAAKTGAKTPTRGATKAKRDSKKKSGMPKGCVTAVGIVIISALIAAAVVVIKNII